MNIARHFTSSKVRRRAGSLVLLFASIPSMLRAAVTTLGAVSPVPPAGGGAVAGAFTVGDAAFGSVTVAGGTAISCNGGGTVGNGPGGVGVVSLSGFGSDWSFSSAGLDLAVGDEGAGQITISGGAVMSVPDDTIMAAQATGTGKLSISGTGSRALITDDLTVGLRGQATLEVLSGGQATCDVAILGDLDLSSGEVLVSGDLSRFSSSLTTIADAGRGTLQVLSGGRWTASGDTSIGVLAGSSGRLDVSGQGSLVEAQATLTVGAAGYGALVVRDGGVLRTAGLTTAASSATSAADVEITGTGALLSIGGNFSTGLGQGQVTVANGGRFNCTAISTISATGRLTLDDGLWESTSITVSGLAQGSGTLRATSVTCASGGIVQVRAGEDLMLTGNFTNAGQTSVTDGWLWVAGVTANSASTGLIAARDAVLWFDGGLNNNGALTAAAGLNEAFGEVTNAASGRVAVSGGATAIFYDDVTNNGTISVSAAGGLASSAVFFGSFSGNGVSGAGRVFLEGDARPGFSPGVMAFGGDVSCGPAAETIMEIGGITPGTQFDRFTVAGAFLRDGSLTVQLINGFVPAVGDSFDLLDFTEANATGSFTALNLPALPAGRAWDTSALATTGVIRVISTDGLTFAKWAESELSDPAASPVGDHDRDGFNNAVEFALGLFPAQPGTQSPAVELHNYGDGDRLRIFFTRPLDRTGVTLRVQASDDLLSWTDLAVSVNSAPFTGPGFVSENRAHPLAEPGLVEVRDLFTTIAAPRRWVRLLTALTP